MAVRRQASNPEKMPAPFSNSSLVIDEFNATSTNSLGYYHGASGGATAHDFDAQDGGKYLNVSTGDVDGECTRKSPRGG